MLTPVHRICDYCGYAGPCDALESARSAEPCTSAAIAAEAAKDRGSRRILRMAFLLLLLPEQAGAQNAQFCAPGASPPPNRTVLVLMANTLDASYTCILRNRLRDTGAFGAVDYIDALAATPTAATMGAFSAALLAATGTIALTY